jgi:hypothetical protein
MATGISDLSQGHVHSELSLGLSPITQVNVSEGGTSPSDPFSAPPEHGNTSPTEVDDDDGWVTFDHWYAEGGAYRTYHWMIPDGRWIDADGVVAHGLLQEDETLVGVQEDACNQGDTYVMWGMDGVWIDVPHHNNSIR